MDQPGGNGAPLARGGREASGRKGGAVAVRANTDASLSQVGTTGTGGTVRGHGLSPIDMPRYATGGVGQATLAGPRPQGEGEAAGRNRGAVAVKGDDGAAIPGRGTGVRRGHELPATLVEVPGCAVEAWRTTTASGPPAKAEGAVVPGGVPPSPRASHLRRALATLI